MGKLLAILADSHKCIKDNYLTAKLDNPKGVWESF